ncbi:MAG: amidohydrolase [Bacillota bacterium]|nr:amidohydrolase [Bacillota bacterium]
MKADKVLKNGKVFSVAADGSRISGSAVAIAGGKIAAVGDWEDMQPFMEDSTEIIDCRGNTILPGLCDAHCHAAWTASFHISCDLFNVYYEDGETAEDVIEKYKDRVAKYIRENPGHEIIRGIGWNLAHFNGSTGETRLPSRHDLDRLSTEKPIILESYCQHNIWVNTKAIEMAGLSAATETPDSGRFTRERDGYPAGMFSEMSAIDLIKKGIKNYDYTVEQYKASFLRYQKELANLYGVTLIQDCLCTENARQAYKELAEEGRLTLRVRGVHAIDRSTAEEDLQALRAAKGSWDVGDLYGIRTAKLFMEGEFYMLEPFEPEIQETLGRPADYTGSAFWTREDGAYYMAEAMKEGLQVHLHAMGDAAVKLAVDCIEDARKICPGTGRDVVAHVMAVPEDYYEKMGKMGLICACQPRWAVYDTDVEDFYIPYVGARRALKFFPIGKLTRAGCTVAYGTDFPVTPPPNPFHEIQCALTRSVFRDAPDHERFKGRVLGVPEDLYADCVGLSEAVKSLSYNGAYQMFLEEITGSIEVGKSADLVILQRDLENTAAEEIYDTKVEKTIFKGEVVYQS